MSAQRAIHQQPPRQQRRQSKSYQPRHVESGLLHVSKGTWTGTARGHDPNRHVTSQQRQPGFGLGRRVPQAAREAAAEAVQPWHTWLPSAPPFGLAELSVISRRRLRRLIATTNSPSSRNRVACRPVMRNHEHDRTGGRLSKSVGFGKMMRVDGGAASTRGSACASGGYADRVVVISGQKDCQSFDPKSTSENT
ncbi:hypothetical protein BC567DRAFT_27222 [Phyllosticta citribraziliensis]